MPPSTTSRGLSRLTRPASPMPSQAPVSSRAASGSCRRPPASRMSASTPARPPPGRPAGEREERLEADLGLPAADRPAAAGRAGRVHRHVPDLAAVPGGAGQRPAADHEPAADADRPGDEHHVGLAEGGTAMQLREDGQVRFVRHGDRDGRAQGARGHLAERDVAPAQVRRHRHEPVAPPDDAGDRDGDPHDLVHDRSPSARAARAARPAARSAGSSLTVRSRLTQPSTSPSRPTTAAAELSTAISSARTTAPPGTRRTRWDGRPGTPSGGAGPSVTRPAAMSSPVRTRMALRVSPVRADELGAGERPAGVQLADDRAEVGASHRPAPLADLAPSVGHPICHPLLQTTVIGSYTAPDVKTGESVGRADDRGRGPLRGGGRAHGAAALGDPRPRSHRAPARPGDRRECPRGPRRRRQPRPGAGRRLRGQARHPARVGLVRRAPRRPRRGRRLHRPPEPPPRRVDHPRPRGREARPVREAARAVRRGGGRDRRGRGPRRTDRGRGVHVPPPPADPRGRWTSRGAARWARSSS